MKRLLYRLANWLDNNPYTHDPTVFFTGAIFGMLLIVLLISPALFGDCVPPQG